MTIFVPAGGIISVRSLIIHNPAALRDIHRHRVFSVPVIFRAIAVVVLAVFFSAGCIDESFTSDPADQPEFSTDTLAFDTVLTEVNSVTRSFKVYNPHGEFLRIGEIRIAGAHPDFFRINVDGRPGPVVRDIEIPARDSIYIFVEALIDPDQPESVSPFIIEASVIFTTLGVDQDVLLVAYGQNANYLPGPDQPNRISLLTCDLGTVTWDDPRPYVLYGTLLIDSCTLVLPAGTRLYVHGGIANNAIGIYQDGLIYTLPNGRLVADGTVERPVIIKDDRTEPDFEGTWAGLRFGPESGPHTLRHTRVSQGIVGIYADSLARVAIEHCQVFNTGGPGFLARHAFASVSNTLFYGNDGQAVALTYGGQYTLDHCTLASFGNGAEALLMNNFFCTDPPLCSEGIYLNPLDVTVRNSIMVGSSTDECWIVDAASNDPSMLRIVMQHNLVMVDDLLGSSYYPAFFTEICNPCAQWSTQDPLFLDLFKDDYHLDTMSVAIGMGMPLPGITDDLDGKPRDPVMPDLGCYEFQE